MESPLLRAGISPGAVLALAGLCDLLPASIPVEIAVSRAAMLYLLLARFTGVKSLVGATELAVIHSLTGTEPTTPVTRRQANGRG